MKLPRFTFPRWKRLGTTTRIAFAMAMWTTTVLLSLRLFGVLGDGHDTLLNHRTRLCESVAVSCSQNISEQLPKNTQLLLEALKHRNPEILSLGFRKADGSLQHSVGDHEANWNPDDGQSINRIVVPVLDGERLYAQIEATFVPPVGQGLLGFFRLPSVRVTVIATLLNLLGFSLWLRRCFKHLDPSQVVPERVRAALDTMAEVILIVDDQNRLMLVNSRLTDVLGGHPDSYQGRPLASLPWEGDLGAILSSVPEDTNEEHKVSLRGADSECRVYKLNKSPIHDDDGQARGRLLSLDDITLIEQQSNELRETLEVLQKSQAEIAAQNEKLQFLATRDPMTGCLNRRSFFESSEATWNSSQRYDHPLSCVMVDVDHFKSINDNFGHATGDEVLKQVASALLATARDSDMVCRYGGEEFCVLLPHVDLEGAKLAAERFRTAIASLEFPELSVTASLGCSDRLQDATSAEGMLEQADQALYRAKKNGRNQVWGFADIAAAEANSPASRANDALPNADVQSPAPSTGETPEIDSGLPTPPPTVVSPDPQLG